MSMSPAEVKDYCLSLPGAHLVVQWGGTSVFKIDAKMFAAMGESGEAVVLKCPDKDMARMLVEGSVGHWAKYFGQKQWVGVKLDSPVLPDEELKARLRLSYATVRKGLTKKIQASLPPFEEGA